MPSRTIIHSIERSLNVIYDMSSFRRFASKHLDKNFLGEYLNLRLAGEEISIYRGDSEILELDSDIRNMPDDFINLGYMQRYIARFQKQDMWTTNRDNALYYAHEEYQYGMDKIRSDYEGTGWVISCISEAIVLPSILRENPDRVIDEQNEEYIVDENRVPLKTDIELTWYCDGENQWNRVYLATYDPSTSEYSISRS